MTFGSALPGTIGLVLAGMIFSFPVRLSTFSLWLLFASPIVFVLTFWALCFAALAKHRPERPFRFIWERITEVCRVPYHLAPGVPVFLLTAIPLSAFSSYKMGHQTITSFDADTFLSDLEILIHGTDPWRLLNSVLSGQSVTYVIGILYVLWFACMFIVSVR